MRHSIACFFATTMIFATGACAVEVIATHFVQKNIYHSPETPSYTAWCNLWRAKDGHLRVAFQQVTDPVVYGTVDQAIVQQICKLKVNAAK